MTINKVWRYDCLGIDYGTKQTGLALGNVNLKISHAYKIVPAKMLFTFIDEIIEKYCILLIVLGLPYQIDNTHSPTYKLAFALYKQLRCRYLDVKIDTTNECLTSYYVRKQLNIPSHIRVDDLCASVILEQYLYSSTYTITKQ